MTTFRRDDLMRRWPIGARVRLMSKTSGAIDVPVGAVGTVILVGSWKRVEWDGIPGQWFMLGASTKLLSPLEELAKEAE